MKIKLASMALIAITVMGCNSSKSTTDSSANTQDNSDMSMVENTKWVISILEGEAVTSKEQNGKEIHFTLNSETNSVTGFSGCNTFMGTYTLKEGNRISFSKMASTRMACPEGDFNEQQLLNIFETADNFTIVGNTLALNKARRAPLAIFKKGAMEQSLIVEKYWKLKTLEGKDVKMADNQEREIFFTLKSQDNRVTGFAGCNSINGEFTLEEGNRIRFHQMATTLKICPDVDVNESEFLKIFEIADNYTITDDELRLNVGRRAPLAVFEAVYFD
ncbi:META domain-containing protein [Gelidibacter salicanalis]|uniref:META domain-containing protein n=1 Tax=Gelidibacter salicanalis TaxID=291193 RepID=A0A5C7AG35_9FLAO|nr:META domain-containing protein [Gelidibacter salicanalis]TXE07720.1 META domain-containing protein [Gelidibacter salicanalis]